MSAKYDAKKVRSMIKDDVWLCANVSSLNVEELKNIQQLVYQLKDPEERVTLKTLCEGTIENASKSPIVPRFVIGLCGKHPIDDKYILSVFDDFYREGKIDIAIYVAELMLTFSDSPYVLKALADCYSIKGEVDKKVATWEHLIKTDRSETDVFYQLAEHYEEAGDNQTALNMYKRVILRHINASDLSSIKAPWPKIINLKGDNAQYIISLATRIAQTAGNDKGVYFLDEAFEKGDFDINSKIAILKKILSLSPNDKKAAEKISGLFRENYAENPRLEYCLENTGLLSNYLDADKAVTNFEKEIEFIEGAFVYHNTWKLGRIRKIEQDQMQIQFLSKKELHTMSCNMAFSSLKILPKQHILVLKAGAPADKIKQHLMDNTEWGLRMLLSSFNGQATFKQIKAELVPSVLKDSEWSTWMVAAKKELSSNPFFSTSDESNDIFILRDTPITFEEKALQVFHREKGFFNKYDIVKDFIRKNGITDSDEFIKMLEYFERETVSSSYTGICSFLILDNFKNKQKMNFIHLDGTFSDRYTKLTGEEAVEIYGEISDSELRRAYIDSIVECDEKWPEVLEGMLHVNPSTYIIECIRNDSARKLNSIISDALENYQSDPDFLLFLFKNLSSSDWKKAKSDPESQLTVKIQLLSFVQGKLMHDVDAQNNRIRAKQLIDEIWGDQELFSFLSDCDTASARRMYSFIENIPGLDDDKKVGTKHFILQKRKDCDVIIGKQEDVVDTGRMIPKGFLCTRAMFNAKSAELDHIMNVEIPENSKEIGTARDLGDLRENAEYQYAKDKQKNLNFMMNKLTDEIDIAKIVNPEDVDTNYVEFGTKVVFTDNKTGKDISYTVLGPWESNPEKNILNFQAPLGLKIYNMTVGENKKFVINDVQYDYTVKSISLADFNL
ncbi:MAG: GreA/GreB family elongation factor [Sphaerochaetaceae bacterium]|nr:GreA/GreB family elongation factor [Sphaerochaetaceae bacterium]